MCKNCGQTIYGKLCTSCGTSYESSKINLKDYHPAERTEIIVDYVAEMKNHSKSWLFILGCLLLTVGAVGAGLVNFHWVNVLFLAYMGIHTVALWLLVYDAVANRTSCGVALVAIKLFKISVVIILILLAVIFLIIGFFLLAFYARLIEFIIMIAIFGGFGFVFIRFYCMSLFSVLDGIKLRLLTGKYTPLDGRFSFSLLSYVGIAILVVSGAIGLLDDGFDAEFIFVVLHSIGLTCCLITLKRYE